MKYKIMDGNEACSYVSYLFSEMAGIYPITPASTMAEKVDELSSKNFNNLYGMPLVVVRSISDIVTKENNSNMFDDNLDRSSTNSALVLLELLK